jgi:hypothetical protein
MDQVSRNSGMSEAEVGNFREERERIVRSKINTTLETEAPAPI